MSQFVSVETPGGVIWAEVSESENITSVELVAPPSEIFKNFEDAVAALKQNAQYLVKTLADAGPGEIEVSFGIRVGVAVNTPIFALAKVSGESNYTVKLKWQAHRTANQHTTPSQAKS